VLQMINHGLSTGGLFATVGMIYERYHTREISHLGGLTRRLPLLAFFFLLFTFSSIGLPGMNGFADEVLILIGMFQRAWTAAPPEWLLLFKTLAVVAVFGVVLGAWYMLYLVQRVFFGPLKEGEHGHDAHHAVHDLSIREMSALVPLVVFVFWIGLFHEFFLSRMRPTLEPIPRDAIRALAERHAPAAVSSPLLAAPQPPMGPIATAPALALGAPELAIGDTTRDE